MVGNYLSLCVSCPLLLARWLARLVIHLLIERSVNKLGLHEQPVKEQLHRENCISYRGEAYDEVVMPRGNRRLRWTPLPRPLERRTLHGVARAQPSYFAPGGGRQTAAPRSSEPCNPFRVPRQLSSRERLLVISRRNYQTMYSATPHFLLRDFTGVRCHDG